MLVTSKPAKIWLIATVKSSPKSGGSIDYSLTKVLSATFGIKLNPDFFIWILSTFTVSNGKLIQLAFYVILNVHHKYHMILFYDFYNTG